MNIFTLAPRVMAVKPIGFGITLILLFASFHLPADAWGIGSIGKKSKNDTSAKEKPAKPISPQKSRLLWQKYYVNIAKHINQNTLGYAGRPATFIVSVLPNGTITNIKIKKSSRSDQCDEALLRGIKSINGQVPLPKGAEAVDLLIEVPVDYGQIEILPKTKPSE